MSIKQNVVYSMNHSRKMLDSLIAVLNRQEDWMYQVHPKANHPLWIVGHLGLADNLFLSLLKPEADHKPEGWEEVFWYGTEISSDSAVYPDPQIVVEYFRDRRAALLEAIDGLSDEDLKGPVPEGSPFAEAPDLAQVLLFVSYHEGMHGGQFSIAHRGLGHAPLFQPDDSEKESSSNSEADAVTESTS